MDKTITQFKKTVKIFGIMICETDEHYEAVKLENAEPFFPIITEYEKENVRKSSSFYIRS